MEEWTKCFISCRHLLALSCSRRNGRGKIMEALGTHGTMRRQLQTMETSRPPNRPRSWSCMLWFVKELWPVSHPHHLPKAQGVATAPKEDVWVSSSNAGQLSPAGSPLARVTQGGLEEGWVFTLEAAISTEMSSIGMWSGAPLLSPLYVLLELLLLALKLGKWNQKAFWTKKFFLLHFFKVESKTFELSLPQNRREGIQSQGVGGEGIGFTHSPALEILDSSPIRNWAHIPQESTWAFSLHGTCVSRNIFIQSTLNPSNPLK